MPLTVKYQVLISSYNSLGDGRYYDMESKSSFAFDHITQVHNRSIQSPIKKTDAESNPESLRRATTQPQLATYRSHVRLLNQPFRSILQSINSTATNPPPQNLPNPHPHNPRPRTLPLLPLGHLPHPLHHHPSPPPLRLEILSLKFLERPPPHHLPLHPLQLHSNRYPKMRRPLLRRRERAVAYEKGGTGGDYIGRECGRSDEGDCEGGERVAGGIESRVCEIE